MILKSETFSSSKFTTQSFTTKTDLIKLIEDSKFHDDLLKIFKLDEINSSVLKIGNAKQLVDSILYLDSLCIKLDINSKVKNVQLDKLLEDEKAIFDIFDINNDFIKKTIRSDKLSAEEYYPTNNRLELLF